MHLTSETTVAIQGIAEPLGRAYAPAMLAYGTRVVAGISPGSGGQTLHGIPAFDLVERAVEACGPIETSVIFSPRYGVLDAALEAIAGGIRQIVIVTRGVPPLDMVRLVREAEATDTLVVGPNGPGLIVPGQWLLGTHPPEFYKPGAVGLVGRSSTLLYEVARTLTEAGLGQSIAAGIGGDRIVGSSLVQWLQILDEDERTEAIVLVGEPGGESEFAAARYMVESIDKPAIAYIAGRHAPPGKPLGHASSTVVPRLFDRREGGKHADAKIAALREAGVAIAEGLTDLPGCVRQALKDTSGDRPRRTPRKRSPARSH